MRPVPRKGERRLRTSIVRIALVVLLLAAASLARGQDPANEAGLTPLHVAASQGHKDVAESRIAKGADINARTGSGETPLALAIEKKHESVVKLLKKLGARN